MLGITHSTIHFYELAFEGKAYLHVCASLLLLYDLDLYYGNTFSPGRLFASFTLKTVT